MRPPPPRTPLVHVAEKSTWPNLFAEAKAQILQAVAPHVQTVRHVGSTSVPSLCAKPIIDILVGVHDWNEARVTIRPLERIGWEFRGPRGIPRRHFFVIR
ncbi:MAG: GrpB family protein, partial [Chloroflexota bacterium]|nr:GrpB family protein [Chloroflexota bacterium]